ncbi:MAG TPA: glycosyltransferase family 87 protein [Ardenticatenaceae bacterium]
MILEKSVRWRERANFAALVTWLLATLMMAASALFFFGPEGHDFRGYYAAGRVFLAGGDPYEFYQIAEVLQETTGTVGNFPFYYPPWYAVVMTLFARLPYFTARVAWLACNVAAWVAGLFFLTRAMQWPPPSWSRWLLYLAATYLFAWTTWRFEQLGVMLFLLLAVSLWAIRTERWALSGAMLALMLTKPSISALIVAALLLWFARERRWRAVLGFALALVVLAIVSAPLVPTYIRHLAEPGFTQGLTQDVGETDSAGSVRITTTFRAWLASFGVNGPVAAALYGLSIVVGLAALLAVLRQGASPLTVASVAVVVAFWVAPYALQYDYPPLTIPLFLVVRDLAARVRERGWNAVTLASGALLAGVLSVPLWERPISDGFWIAVGLAALLALHAVSNPINAAGDLKEVSK